MAQNTNFYQQPSMQGYSSPFAQNNLAHVFFNQNTVQQPTNNYTGFQQQTGFNRTQPQWPGQPGAQQAVSSQGMSGNSQLNALFKNASVQPQAPSPSSGVQQSQVQSQSNVTKPVVTSNGQSGLSGLANNNSGLANGQSGLSGLASNGLNNGMNNSLNNNLGNNGLSNNLPNSSMSNSSLSNNTAQQVFQAVNAGVPQHTQQPFLTNQQTAAYNAMFANQNGMAQVLQTAQQQPAAQYPNTGVQQQQQRFT
jgi:hypothetical protein